MMEIQEELLDAYAKEKNIAAVSFELMGRLLDFEYVKKRIELLGVDEIFIYGGGYLGIQFYHTASRFVNVSAVIDQKGKLAIDISHIPVMDAKEFEKAYKGQKVIVASIRFFNEIQNELSAFIPRNQILFLGEFLGGILI